jgi:hypothetical protein
MQGLELEGHDDRLLVEKFKARANRKQVITLRTAIPKRATPWSHPIPKVDDSSIDSFVFHAAQRRNVC